MSHRVIIVLIALTILIFAVITLANDDLFINKKNIVLVGYSKYSQKWIDIKEGALSSGQKQGINITPVASDSAHAVSDQILLIEQAIEDKPDAIIIMPTDLEELAVTVEKVAHNNIDLVIIDNYQQIQEFAVPRVGTNAESIAGDLLEKISLSKRGNIKIGCIFSYDDNGKTLSIYNEFAKRIKDYDTIELVYESNSAIDENVAGAATQVMLNSHDLDYVVCFHETITKGACEYIAETIENGDGDLLNDTKIVGIGSIDECAKFLEDNILYAVGIQSYYNMGYLAVENYAEVLYSDVYAAYYIVQKEDLLEDKYQKILFRIN